MLLSGHCVKCAKVIGSVLWALHPLTPLDVYVLCVMPSRNMYISTYFCSGVSCEKCDNLIGEFICCAVLFVQYPV